MLPYFISMLSGRLSTTASVTNPGQPSLAIRMGGPIRDLTTGETLGYQYSRNPDAEPAVSDFIGRQLNIDVLVNREKSLIRAMTAPESWIRERQAKYDELKTSIGNFYAEQLAKYYQAGYSLEQSEKMAEESANRILPIHLQDIEVLHPGSSTLFANAAFQMDKRNTNFGLYSGAAESGPNHKAIYKEERARRKAKKRKSKQITA